MHFLPAQYKDDTPNLSKSGRITVVSAKKAEG